MIHPRNSGLADPVSPKEWVVIVVFLALIGVGLYTVMFGSVPNVAACSNKLYLKCNR